MNERNLSECFTLLSLMNSGSEQRWRDELKPLYALVLRPVDDTFGKKAVEWAVLHEEWRPSPARLRKIVARIASPYPCDDDAYAEIMDKAVRIGSYGVPDHDNPNVFYEGPPPMSHPVVARIVAHLGGWRFLCEGDAQMQEGLKKQVAGSHESVAGQWEQEVSDQLHLPASVRNPIYFQNYSAYRPVAPPVDGELLAIPSRRKEPSVVISDMPEPVRRLLAGIKTMHAHEVSAGKATGQKWGIEEAA